MHLPTLTTGRLLIRPFETDDIDACQAVLGAVEGLTVEQRRERLRWTVAYELGPDHRGEGYATEAVGALIRWAGESMRLQRIVATTSYDNAGSIGVMERLGMTVTRNPLDDPPWFQVVGVHEYDAGESSRRYPETE